MRKSGFDMVQDAAISIGSVLVGQLIEPRVGWLCWGLRLWAMWCRGVRTRLRGTEGVWCFLLFPIKWGGGRLFLGWDQALRCVFLKSDQIVDANKGFRVLEISNVTTCREVDKNLWACDLYRKFEKVFWLVNGDWISRVKFGFSRHPEVVRGVSGTKGFLSL